MALNDKKLFWTEPKAALETQLFPRLTRTAVAESNERQSGRRGFQRLTPTSTSLRRRSRSRTPCREASSGATSKRPPAYPAAVARRRAAAARRKLKYGEKVDMTFGAQGILETASVTAPTRANYLALRERLWDFIARGKLGTQTPRHVDDALCKFCDTLYLDGEGEGVGRTLQAAVLEMPGDLEKGGTLHTPRFRRALKGWHRLAPTLSRLPTPESWMMAIGAVMLVTASSTFLGAQLCLYTLVTFSTYLRPSACMRLHCVDLVPPVVMARGSAFRTWVLAIAPWSRGVPSKTGTFDETVALDDTRFPWLGSLLDQLVRRRGVGLTPEQVDDLPLWGFDAAFYLEQFRKAVEFLGTTRWITSPYQLRHGGASRDLLLALRSLPAVQNRGHWATTSSMRIYGKPGRQQQVLAEGPQAALRLGELFYQDAEKLMSDGLRGIPPGAAFAVAVKKARATPSKK